MRLTRQNLSRVSNDAVKLPIADHFDLPERVLQFGTSVLLRGLPDYYIDKANKQGVFNGRVVIVKSTTGGDISSFADQDGLYTHCMRGIAEGYKIEENILNASVSRVLSASNEWDKILELARSASLQLIISNTTEVGITLVDDNIHATPPVSFPGRLLAFLYKRYQHFKADAAKGVIIVPTELIPANADTLRSILFQLSDQNGLETGFKKWLEASNVFCNSLVDRIVPGKLPKAEATAMEERLGYRDELMIMSEPYGLWAIESNDEKVKQVLSFEQCDEGMVITEDISMHRELKLRLLNGSHTFTCGLAFLSGFQTVKEAMNNPVFEAFISGLMMDEIAPSIKCKGLSQEKARNFASRVLDRYRNPFIEHQWLSITLQYTSKMNTRNSALIKDFIDRNGMVPESMSLGLAAWILFMKTEKAGDEKYYGQAGGRQYAVNDTHAGLFSQLWKDHTVDQLVTAVFSNKEIWQPGISGFPGLIEEVTKKLKALINLGPLEMMRKITVGEKHIVSDVG